MRSTGRPSNPPFLLMSSFQIWTARRAGLPFADSPPVRAMPKPILMGSAAWATKRSALARRTTTDSAPMKPTRTIDRNQDCLIASSLSARSRGRRRSLGGPRCGSARHVVKHTAGRGGKSPLDIASPASESYAQGLTTESRRPSNDQTRRGSVIVDRYSKVVLTVIAAALVVIAARPLLPETGLRAWLLPEVAQAQTAAPRYEVTIPKAWGKFVGFSNNNVLLEGPDHVMRIVDVEGRAPEYPKVKIQIKWE